MTANNVSTPSIGNQLNNLTPNYYIRRDLNKIRIHQDDTPIIFVDRIEDDDLHLEAAISGPMLTPYENGVFLLDILLPEQFPFSPPRSVTFKRATMHPNVNEYGRFMSELLLPNQWLPSTTIKDILEHVWVHLAIPDIHSAECDPNRAQLYKSDKAAFESMARDYAIKYARAM